MAVPVLKKKEIETNVYDAAMARFRRLFDEFDTVAVSFSGGKDSTVCLNLALEAAHEAGRLPLDVYFWDEEAIQPETVAYVERVAARPDVRMKWLCVPIQHRNACSRQQPYWYPWLEDDREKWVRELPDHPHFRMVPGTEDFFKLGFSVPDLAANVYGPEYGRVADVRGIRADESLRRYRTVATRLKDNWIAAPRNLAVGRTRNGNLSFKTTLHSYPVSPIYDWSTFDVWTAPKLFGWDYNRTYDLMNMAGMTISDQRVCPPYGEEPLKGLWIYAQCWPELWHKMIGRVHGAATAGRYAKTDLYGWGDLTRPEGLSWKDWCYRLLDLYPPKLRAQIAGTIAQMIEQHKVKTNRPIPDDSSDPITGLSWRFLAMLANRGDLKGRRQGNITGIATQVRAKMGLTVEDFAEADEASRY